MPAPKLFPKSDWQRFAQQLDALPDHPDGDRIAVRQAIGELAGRIRAAQAKGYTLEQITSHAKANGIDISASTLKAAMRNTGKRGNTRARRNAPEQDRRVSASTTEARHTAEPPPATTTSRPSPSPTGTGPAATPAMGRGSFAIRPDTDDL